MAKNIIFSQEQKELIALLPDGLPKMTDGAKLVLSNIIYWYGTDFAKENGYVFRSDSDMVKDTGIGRNTVGKKIRELETKGFFDKIKRGVFGDRTNGTEFYLTEEMKEKIHFKPIESTSTIKTSTSTIKPISSTNNEIGQLMEQMNTILMKLNELSDENKQLRDKIDILEEKFNGATDSDTDLDIEKNNYSTGTSCTGTNMNKKESILTDTKEKPEVTCWKGTGDDYIQPPAKPYFFDPRYFGKRREQATEATVVSSSLQFIEEENHPDTNTSSNDGLKQADRLNISQSITKTQPQPLDKGNAAEWLKNIRSELKHEVYEWSLTLTCTPEYLTGDDYNPIVTKVMKNHPEWINYQGQFSLCELGQYTLQLMENRMNNSDITGIIAKNNRKRYPDFNDNADIVSESTVRLREAV